MELLYMYFGSVIGFTDHLNTQLMAALYTVTHRAVFSVAVFTALLGSGYQLRSFPFLWDSEMPSTSSTATRWELAVPPHTLSRPTYRPFLFSWSGEQQFRECFFVWAVAWSTKMPSHAFPSARWKTQLLALRPPAQESAWRPCWRFSCFGDVSTLLDLGSL
jgi:hypothetical protein